MQHLDDHEQLYKLLRRAVDAVDDDHEGMIAFSKFKQRVKNTTGTIFFFTEDFSNPLMFIVKDQKEQISQLETENEQLKKQISLAGSAPKKHKMISFPWDKYQDIELRAYQMRFIEKCSVSEIMDYIIDHAPEAEGNTTFINQRFVQGRPSPSFCIEVKQGSETIDWSELWKIGTREHADGWIQRVMRYGNGWEAFNLGGNVPHDWIKLDPNKFINAKGRKTLRELYHSNGFQSAGKELETLVEKAGKDGTTREELKNLGISSRRFEIEKQSVIFQNEGKYVHYSFAHHYPNNLAAQVAALKYEQQHGMEVVIKNTAVETA